MNKIATKQIIEILKTNVNLIMENLKLNSVENDNTSFNLLFKNDSDQNVADICFAMNGGDIREIKLFVSIEKNIHYMLKLNDSSIGCGKYTSIWNNYLGAHLQCR